jgi:hypothetical protein
VAKGVETNANSKNDRQQELKLIEQTSVTQISELLIAIHLRSEGGREKPGLPVWRSLDNMAAMHILRKMEAGMLGLASSSYPPTPHNAPKSKK